MIELSSSLDLDNRVYCFINNWIAYDPITKIYLYKSSGRRISGRKSKYLLHITDDKIIKILAYSDNEAYQLALTKLIK